MSNPKLKEFMQRCNNDRNLMEEFVKDPKATLEANGIDSHHLPKELAEKLAGGGMGTTTKVLIGSSAFCD